MGMNVDEGMIGDRTNKEKAAHELDDIIEEIVLLQKPDGLR